MKPRDLKEGKLYVLDMSRKRDGDDRVWDALAYNMWHGTACIFLKCVPDRPPPAGTREPLSIHQAGFHQFLWGDKIISLTTESIEINLVTPEQFKKKHRSGHTTTGS